MSYEANLKKEEGGHVVSNMSDEVMKPIGDGNGFMIL